MEAKYMKEFPIYSEYLDIVSFGTMEERMTFVDRFYYFMKSESIMWGKFLEAREKMGDNKGIHKLVSGNPNSLRSV